VTDFGFSKNGNVSHHFFNNSYSVLSPRMGMEFFYIIRCEDAIKKRL